MGLFYTRYDGSFPVKRPEKRPLSVRRFEQSRQKWSTEPIRNRKHAGSRRRQRARRERYEA